MLPLQRGEAPEEGYFTFTYSPVRDETGGVGGVFCAVLETTDKVIEGRRVRLLNALAEATLAKTPGDACGLAAAQLAQAPSDVPFALLYLLDPSTNVAQLAGAANIEAGHELAPAMIFVGTDSIWSLDIMASHGSPRTVPLSGGPAASRGAVVLPIERPGGGRPLGFIVAGLSTLLANSPSYARFHNLLAAGIGQAVGNAAAYEAERQRAEALAQIDRAKTEFFSNVSHEFRTPLTLMLGPLEDALEDAFSLPPGQRERLVLVHRNARRLLKLVNSLLDFSRLEAGRVYAQVEPTDLSHFTAGLASSFESIITQAGIRLIVDCPPLEEPVYVDQDMWEKVVLNLVSNAFKFTFEGEIAVRMRRRGDRVEMVVRDTGTGIPENELPRIFERFHRVQGAQGRSYEGSGIGLALVQELVRLHGGTVTVESTPGRGSAFTVSVPAGHAPFPPEGAREERRGAPMSKGAGVFVDEAAQWLLNRAVTSPAAAVSEAAALEPPSSSPRGHVLLADDNPDMRRYIGDLLKDRFTVEAVADGQAALDAALARPPDVILSDVMMPVMDGFGLLRALRSDARTSHVPVVLLSARAGEEAKVEGLSAGADDYLVKPFGARELAARVEGAVKGARGKAERERLLREMDAIRTRLLNLIQSAPAFVATLKGPHHVFEMANPLYQKLVGEGRTLVGLSVREALPEIAGQGFIELLDSVYRSGEPFFGRELRAELDRQESGRGEKVFVNFVYQPRRDPRGEIEGIDVFGFDVTTLVEARNEAERLAQELGHRAEFEQQLIGIVSHDLRTPLNVVVLGASLLKGAAGLDERQTKSVARISTAAERANRMIRDLLDFTQARLGGGIRVQPSPTDLDSLVEGVLEETRATYPGREIRFVRSGAARGEWDPDRIAQVAQNLITNAIKYSPEGSPVRVQTSADAIGVALVIHNEGAPIPANRVEQLFKPLERARDEIDKADRSIGLGLYIVKQIVNAHGGSVAVSSTATDGTTFTVGLPRRPPA